MQPEHFLKQQLYAESFHAASILFSHVGEEIPSSRFLAQAILIISIIL